jgi:hypothetical protein
MLLENETVRLMAFKIVKRHKLSTDADVVKTGRVVVDNVTLTGNFTVVALDVDGEIFTGAAKRNPLDPPDIQRGVRLAARRALRLAFGK